jgi:hypothetical protein
MSRGRKQRLLASFAVTVLFMCNTIRHMFEGVRPFDWLMLIVEVLVLGLIAFEIVREEWRHRAERKQQRIIGERSESLRQLLSKGQELQRNAPASGESTTDIAQDIAQWSRLIDTWHQEVATLLASYSSRAAMAFNHGVPKGSTYMGIAVAANRRFGFLLSRLENLQGILENPQIYL